MGNALLDPFQTIFSQRETIRAILRNFNNLNPIPQIEIDHQFPATSIDELLKLANSVADIWKSLAQIDCTIQQKEFIIQNGINNILTNYQNILPFVLEQAGYLENLSQQIPWKKDIFEITMLNKTYNQFQYEIYNIKDGAKTFNYGISLAIKYCNENLSNIPNNLFNFLECATSPLARIRESLTRCKTYLSQMENEKCSLVDSYSPPLVIEIKKQLAIVKFLESCFSDIESYHRHLKSYVVKCSITYEVPINQSLKAFKASHPEHQTLGFMIAEDQANEEINLEQCTFCTIS